MAEDVAWGELEAELACSADELDGDDGIAAELEEVVGGTDVLAAEDVLPGLAEPDLGLAADRDP